MARLLNILILCYMLSFSVFAAGNDSLTQSPLPHHYNIIKFNPTPMILWDARNLTFSYERILNPRQSVSVEAGYLVFAQVVEDTLTDLVNITSHDKHGLNLTAEYRFYLTKLNTRPIPAGIYIGPYLTYYRYQFKNGLEILNSGNGENGMLQGDYWSFNGGVELGYQFVFWKRLTLDLVLVGPSISYYGGKTTITGNLSADQLMEINQALYDKLIERFPAAQNFSVDKSVQQTGKLDIFRIGFRYLMQIGFCF